MASIVERPASLDEQAPLYATPSSSSSAYVGDEAISSEAVDYTEEHKKLLTLLGDKKALDFEPAWLAWANKNTGAAEQYRQARSRLWKPENVSEEEINSRISQQTEELSSKWKKISDLLEHKDVANDAKLCAYVAAYSQAVGDLVEEWQFSDRQEQLDHVVQPEWGRMSPQQQSLALLRARFDCIRRLGWRKGYSSGYPLSVQSDETTRQEREAILSKLREPKKSSRREGMKQLFEQDEKDAWIDWQKLPKHVQVAEEKAVWENRDRSVIYVDDASTSLILGEHKPRWYEVPQRTGSLSFLPNVVIRLVRNSTKRNGKYDSFKATFRVPLNMHKHNVRSYLLAIYGLRTTWCRSMIYRAPVVRLRNGQKAVGDSSRTFKKVEVGLLEPFVFPEITDSFQRKHLYKAETIAQEQVYRLKMTGKRRWRGHRLPKPAEEDRNSAAVEEKAVLRYTEDDRRRVSPSLEGLSAARLQDRVRNWKGGIPTKRHSRILQLIHERRLNEEAAITARMSSLQREDSEQKSQ